MYVIRLTKSRQPCWLSDGEGDPPRTLTFENAKRFKCKSTAKRVLAMASKKYPFRNYKIEEV